MTDGPTEGGEDRPDRSPARPFRVVRFDDLADAEEARPVRVAAFDAVDTPDTASPPSRAASFDGLGGRGARRTSEDRPTRARAARRPDRGAGDPADTADADPAAQSRRRRLSVARPDTRPDTRPDAWATQPGAARPAEAAGAPPAGALPAGALPAGALPAGALPAGTPSSEGRAGAGALGADADGDVDGADGIPPDAPLPRGRRRRARVGRLGPDADPDEPTPDADPVAVAREMCLRLLTDRARTRQELTHALARKGVAADVIATVLDRFDEVGLIDDAAFAEQWVRSRHAHRGLGRRAIAVELRRKGVADDVAREALAEVDADAERGRARELVDRKLRSLTVGTAEQRVVAARRLVGMLARKGYGAGTAYDVVREALAAHGAETDELGPVELPE